MGSFRLFVSILARDLIDGGGSCRVLKATTIEDAREEARFIIEDLAPEGSCDLVCDFAAIVDARSYEEICSLKVPK